MADAEQADYIAARHRKERRDLVSQITQKKKSATKKTRKGVNEECERLERELDERHAQELAPPDESPVPEADDAFDPADHDAVSADGIQEASMVKPTPDNKAAAPKKQNRAKARLARRAAEQEALVAQAQAEAADMPDLREQERRRMAEQLQKHNLSLKEIRADGHCLYAAVADQMTTQSLDLTPKILPASTPEYKQVRYAAAGYMAQHPDDFRDFMEEPLETYLASVRDTGEWGGHLEIQALAKAYGVTINILHSDGRVDRIEPDSKDAQEIWLGYYRHSHGLGEHYNSLRKSP